MKRILILWALLCPFVSMAQVADSTKRLIKLDGAINFRDIGGYHTKEGKQVKWGKIYRAAEINKLSSADLKKLQQLDLAYVFDFRGTEEAALAPDRLPQGTKRISLPAGSEGKPTDMMKSILKVGNPDSAMQYFYSNLSPFKARYKPVFDTLLKTPVDRAVMYHCTAGKDRTGIATALILYALGVDENTIMADYEATNVYRKVDNQRMMDVMVKSYNMKPEMAKELMAANPKYLEATFKSIRKQYGSIDHYLETEMGLTTDDLNKLRAKYLE